MSDTTAADDRGSETTAGYPSSDRRVGDLAPPPCGPAPGMTTESTAGEAREALREMRATLADTFERIERERGSMLFPDEMADAFLASNWLDRWRPPVADEAAVTVPIRCGLCDWVGQHGTLWMHVRDVHDAAPAPVADDVREAVRLADCGEDPVCPLPGIENACEKHLAEFKAWKATR